MPAELFGCKGSRKYRKERRVLGIGHPCRWDLRGSHHQRGRRQLYQGCQKHPVLLGRKVSPTLSAVFSQKSFPPRLRKLFLYLAYRLGCTYPGRQFSVSVIACSQRTIVFAGSEISTLFVHSKCVPCGRRKILSSERCTYKPENTEHRARVIRSAPMCAG